MDSTLELGLCQVTSLEQLWLLSWSCLVNIRHFRVLSSNLVILTYFITGVHNNSFLTVLILHIIGELLDFGKLLIIWWRILGCLLPIRFVHLVTQHLHLWLLTHLIVTVSWVSRWLHRQGWYLLVRICRWEGWKLLLERSRGNDVTLRLTHFDWLQLALALFWFTRCTFSSINDNLIKFRRVIGVVDWCW